MPPAPATAQQVRTVPVRDLGPVVAQTRQSLGLIFGVWQFGDGRILVNDGTWRRILLFDSTLTTAEVVGDTARGAPILYRFASPLIPFAGDSVLFSDVPSSSLLLVGPGGRVVRTLAPPKASDYHRLRQSAGGADNRGRLLYRGVLPSAPGATVLVDSAPIVRGDFDTRATDTVSLVKMPTVFMYRPAVGADGLYRMRDSIAPVTYIDEWTVHSDGSVAILRSHDYHIDWISPDGSRTSSPKMPFDWRRITDDDKARIIDSTNKAWDAKPLAAKVLTMGEATSMFSRWGVRLDQAATVTLPDGNKGVPVEQYVVPASQIPDYNPPIRAGALRADRDGNLWILPNTSAQSRKGGLVYDIVNRRGELTERVEIPAGRSVAGFGPKGIVYLMSGDREKGFTLERARFR
jgi:hypothetical protein